MASMKTTICVSFAILATTFVVSASAGHGSFCGNADDRVLCRQLIGRARTWEAAMTNALNAVVVKVNAGRSAVEAVESKLPRNLKPLTKDSISSTCHEAYENIVDNLDQCLGYTKDDPYSSLNTYLSAITFSDCTDGLDEFGVSVPEATQFADEILRLTSTLLALANKK